MSGNLARPQDVIVVNPANNPVPVEGIVQVGSIVLVRLVDEPARQPFQRQVELTLDFPQFEGEVSLEVPSGQRLVIEYVSVDATAVTAAGIPVPRFSMRTVVGGVSVNYPLVTQIGFEQETRLEQLVRVYADPGISVFFHADLRRQVSAAPRSIIFGISGHLVNLT